MKKDNHIYCNMCGKEVEVRNDIPMEDVLSVKKAWGYFSEQDGIQCEFDLCEECCQRLMGQFLIPAEVTEQKELL